jgi:hypothetical protein
VNGRALDTAPEIASRYREMLLAQSPSDRIVMGCGLFEVARSIALSSFVQTDDAVARRVHLFTRLYERDFDADTSAKIKARLRQG